MGKYITTEEMYRLPNWFFEKHVHQSGWKVHDPETLAVIEDHTKWYCDRDYDEMIAQVKEMLLHGYKLSYIGEKLDIPNKYLFGIARKLIPYSIAFRKVNDTPYAANTDTMQRIMRSREEDAIRRITEIVMA